MKVYALEEWDDDPGSVVLGVYSNLERAKLAAGTNYGPSAPLDWYLVADDTTAAWRADIDPKRGWGTNIKLDITELTLDGALDFALTDPLPWMN